MSQPCTDLCRHQTNRGPCTRGPLPARPTVQPVCPTPTRESKRKSPCKNFSWRKSYSGSVHSSDKYLSRSERMWIYLLNLTNALLMFYSHVERDFALFCCFPVDNCTHPQSCTTDSTIFRMCFISVTGTVVINHFRPPSQKTTRELSLRYYTTPLLGVTHSHLYVLAGTGWTLAARAGPVFFARLASPRVYSCVCFIARR